MDLALQLKDAVTPELKKALDGLTDKKPLLTAMQAVAVQLTHRAFHEPGIRPAVWPARQGAEEKRLLLVKNGWLKASVRPMVLTDSTATWGSDRVYAAIHQFGGTIRPKDGKKALATPFGPRAKVTIPARPYFPFHDKKPSAALVAETQAAIGGYMKALGFGKG